MLKLSVIICTYNPARKIINEVLSSLEKQSLSKDQWELIVVDNNSSPRLTDVASGGLDVSWHLNSKIIVEHRPGLSFARVAGVENSTTDLVVFVDDDNMVGEDYLKLALQFYEDHPEVGCFGGKSIPVFATKPPEWFFKTGISLGCRDLGNAVFISDFKEKNFSVKTYPQKAPIGTGMVIQKKAFMEYIEEVQKDTQRLQLGRKGKKLTSGEDNDIILTIIKKGYEIAYVPSLEVNHLIPGARYTREYLEKMAYESNRSWVKVLEYHGIKPWKKISRITVPIRKFKSYVSLKAWQSPLNYIKWKASCGLFEGRASLK